MRFFLRRAAFGLALVALIGATIPGCPRGPVKDVRRSETRLDLAKDFLRKGELEAADTEAQKALSFDQNNAEAHHVLGLIDLFRARSTQRLIEIDECLTGVDAEALQADKDQHLIAADVHLARAVAQDPGLGEGWASRGTVATLLARYDDAITYFKKALELPASLQNIALVRANLGWAYFHKDDLVSATKELLQATHFQPGMCVSTYRLGRVYFAREQWENALQKFRQAAGPLGCPIQDAHLFMMRTYVEIGALDELPEAARACVEMAPRSCVAAQCRTMAASLTMPATETP